MTMKPLHLLPLLLVMACGCSLPADSASKAPSRTKVVFDHPEKFTDVRDAYVPSDSGRDAILSRLRNYLADKADMLLPEGYGLTVTFSDIDLAGDFEPWRGAQWTDVRIIKPIYPPRLVFTYSVTDPSGRVVKKGSENILDMTFQMRLLTPYDTSNDTLAYEKDILNDWARATLSGLKRA
jgi:hypothetical protein